VSTILFVLDLTDRVVRKIKVVVETCVVESRTVKTKYWQVPAYRASTILFGLDLTDHVTHKIKGTIETHVAESGKMKTKCRHSRSFGVIVRYSRGQHFVWYRNEIHASFSFKKFLAKMSH
jgi:hypothetical protein